MRKYARFAALFLSLALPAAGEVREASDPSAIAVAFPRAARVRLVNVWATWCVPCVAEMEDLRAIDEMFGPELALVGVSLDDMIPGAKKESVVRFLDARKIKYPNLYYTGNNDALARQLRFTGEIPITVAFDARGRELWRHQGAVNRKETIEVIRRLLRRNQ
jgi:thiol-disulfide isomerase/thioredoxin